VVRRVEEGEEIEITVAGRPAARLVPTAAAPRRWRHWDQIAPLFETRFDAEWSSDRELIDQSLLNRWERCDESGT
jgi:antitoxin (DNA-binding transcriptional repressor) of toxin-antitoxin stability system